MKQPYDIIKIDKYTGKVEMPDLLLMTRSFDIIGKIPHYTNWNMSLVGNGVNEISFNVNKYVNGKICPVWDDLIDLKIINVMGFGRFEISVDYTDNTQTVKSVHGMSLEVELAQIPLYEFHVNDEDSTSSDFDDNGNFIPTVFYDPEHKAHSLLHRALADKAPHWSIGYVTPYIALDEESQPEDVGKFQRTYTVDGTTIYDFLTGDVAKESNVIFIFDTFNRKINCYNLCDCIDQETGEVWVKGIGEDTLVFISKNKLANEIAISSNKDNVKNCFRIEGGDDVITDMVRAVNMNGSNYIYQFADFQYHDMPKDLVDTINTYHKNLSKQTNAYYGNGDIDDFINGTLTLHITSELEAATALSICQNNKITTNNVDISDYSSAPYWYIVTLGNSKELYASGTAKTPNKTVTSAFETMGIYSRLCVKYDELAYFESSMMPDVHITKTTAEEQYNLMVEELTKPDMFVGVSSLNYYDNNPFAGVSKNVEAIANILIDARYKAEVIKDSASFSENEKGEHIWTGNIRITRAANESDYFPKTDEQINASFEVKINDDELTFTRQKIEKALHKGSMLDIDFEVAEMDDNEIRKYFNLYSLNRLKSFYDGYNSCLSILMQLNIDSPVCKDMYDKYYNRMRIISNPPTEENPDPIPGVMDIRQQQVNDIKTDIKNITAEQKAFQKEWNFQNCLEKARKDFYKIFCSYRREDTYTNSNYISDGLSTSECLAKAKELVEAATAEAKKACVLQRTISTSLNNLFALPEFESLYEKFALFNYIRIRTEDEILKLRLIGVEFSGDTVESIHVTFSEQIESIDGKLSDLQSIVQQAQSMATSFPSTALQAEKGEQAQNTVLDMYTSGLNAAKTMLTNNDDNEVTITQSGIICKRMDDEGSYGEKQLRITGNMMAFTKNNWKSVEMAIGETTFKDPTKPEGKNEVKAYGVIADAIVGKLVASERMYIGNKSGNVLITGDGIKINKGTITWGANNVNAPEMGNINGLSEFKNKVNTALTGSATTEIGSDYVISPKIGGGYLHIANGNYSVEIDPNHKAGNDKTKDGYLFCIRNKNKSENDVIMGVTNNGDGYFHGDVIANSLELEIGSEQEDKNFLKITKNGLLMAKNAVIYGNIYADNGYFSGELKSANGNFTGIIEINGTNGKGAITINGDDTTDRVQVQAKHNDIKYYSRQDYQKFYVGDNEAVTYANKGIIMSLFDKSSGIPHIESWYGNDGGYLGSRDECFELNSYRILGYSKSHYDSRWEIGFNGIKLHYLDNKFFDVSSNGACHIYGNLTVDDDLMVDNNAYISDWTINNTRIFTTSARQMGENGYEGIFLINGESDKDYIHVQNTEAEAMFRVTYNGSVYSADGKLSTSDKNKKHNIKELSDKYEKLFTELKPITYIFNGKTRTHVGYIAQDVESSLKKVGLDTSDFAGYWKEPKWKENDEGKIEYLYDENGNEIYDCGLRYDEFIALNTHMLQKLYKKVDNQQQEIEILKKQI